MNLMELLFVTTALGGGAGLALVFGHKHGAIGALLGFVGGVAVIFIALGIVVAIARTRKHKGSTKQHEK